jgi:hypothetical protein
MSFMNEFTDMMPRLVGITPFVSQTIAGLPAYGTRTDYPARIEMRDIQIRLADGTVIAGRGKIIFLQTISIHPRDLITVPAGIPGPVNPTILNVSENDDELGGCYTALVFG